ncbi:MAG: RNA-binding protein [Gammaproteobacteria bacterium]|nr:RNA-binding protein [Gammaproteobacteria bacterium]
MTARVFVGSLPYGATELDLKEYFEQAGKVVYVKIVKSKETDLSRGFGFVEMSNETEADEALKLTGSQFGNRKIWVKLARENEGYKAKGGK